jgi:hypothetical protein
VSKRTARAVLSASFFVLVFAACYTEPGIKVDTHIPPVNPFAGVWQAGNDYYVFKNDGTGGISASNTGTPLAGEFSYFVWYGQGAGVPGKRNTLITAAGDISTINRDTAVIRQYRFTENSDGTITVIPRTLTGPKANGTFDASDGSTVMTFTRQSGEAAVLAVDNPFIGEWHAVWNGAEHDGSQNLWSWKFRNDGTVRAYHHGLHQFDNGYLTRGGLLVILGEWRWDDTFGYISSTYTVNADGGIRAVEKDHGEISWDFKSVETAEWK